MYLSIYQDVSTYWKERDMSKTILAEGINMIVETEGEELLITMGDFTPHDKVIVIQYLVSNLSKMSRIPYNEILMDLQEYEESEEPITEAKQVKKNKKKKERK